MRVLSVIESLGHGGAEQLLLNVLPELQARGHRCDVLTLWPPYKPRGGSGAAFGTSRSLRPDLERAGVRVHALPWSYSRRWELPWGAARVASAARRLGADVVHSHLLFANLYAGLARPALGQAASVCTLHNTDFDFFRSSLPGRAVARVLPPILRRGFDGLAAVAPPIAEHFQHHVPGLGIETILNAVPTPDISAPVDREEILRRWGASPERFVILVAARLAPEKNHALLIEALELLRRDSQTPLAPQVLVAGVGALRPELERQVREKNLGGQVIFCGHIEHSGLQELMLAADAFVLPSLHEGLPIALAEAMALGRPVLATSVGGVPTLVEDGRSGLLVPASDARALADAIARLMEDSHLRRDLGQAARQRIEGSFSTRVIARRWEDFYLSAIERRRS